MIESLFSFFRRGHAEACVEALLADPKDCARLICDARHEIVRANPAARRLLGGLGRRLNERVAEETITHALERGDGAPFVCVLHPSAALLEGRITPLPGLGGYAAAFAPVGQGPEADESDRLAFLRDLRGPVGSLRAAAETVAAYPDMNPDERRAFDRVLGQEAAALSARIEAMEARLRERAAARHFAADLYSLDLINALAHAVAQGDGVRLVPVGVPAWLHGDSPALLAVLRHLVRRLARVEHVRQADIEARAAATHVAIRLSWKGEAVAAVRLNAWLDEPVDDDAGLRPARDILDRHGSEPWSRSGADGWAELVLPVPAPVRPPVPEEAEDRPEPPAMALLAAHADPGRRGDADLSALPVVAVAVGVADVAAVRIVGGRVLTGESFEGGEGPAAAVLARFRVFAGDAVLVMHNAGFVLSHWAFDGVVLDSLALATAAGVIGVADGARPGTVARRLGVEPMARGTLDAALIQAEMFVRLTGRLQDGGIVTLSRALAAGLAAADARARARGKPDGR